MKKERIIIITLTLISCILMVGFAYQFCSVLSLQNEKSSFYQSIPDAMSDFWEMNKTIYTIEGSVLNHSVSISKEFQNKPIQYVTILKPDEKFTRTFNMIFDMEPNCFFEYHSAIIWGKYVQFVGEWYQLRVNDDLTNIFRCFYYRQIYELN